MRPFYEQFVCAASDVSCQYFSGANRDRSFGVSIKRMKVRWIVVIVVHVEYDGCTWPSVTRVVVKEMSLIDSKMSCVPILFFGKNFGELLFSDVQALSEAIKTADAALRLRDAWT